jgi:hypothetical protein
MNLCTIYFYPNIQSYTAYTHTHIELLQHGTQQQQQQLKTYQKEPVDFLTAAKRRGHTTTLLCGHSNSNSSEIFFLKKEKNKSKANEGKEFLRGSTKFPP